MSWVSLSSKPRPGSSKPWASGRPCLPPPCQGAPGGKGAVASGAQVGSCSACHSYGGGTLGPGARPPAPQDMSCLLPTHWMGRNEVQGHGLRAGSLGPPHSTVTGDGAIPRGPPIPSPCGGVSRSSSPGECPRLQGSIFHWRLFASLSLWGPFRPVSSHHVSVAVHTLSWETGFSVAPKFRKPAVFSRGAVGSLLLCGKPPLVRDWGGGHSLLLPAASLPLVASPQAAAPTPFWLWRVQVLTHPVPAPACPHLVPGTISPTCLWAGGAKGTLGSALGLL